MRDKHRSVWILPVAFSLAALAYSVSWEPPHSAPLGIPLARAPFPFSSILPDRSLPTPSDTPAQLSCSQAQSVATQARDNLAQPPPTIDPHSFASITLDWLDPHGLWSVAPDSPIRSSLLHNAQALQTTLLDPEDTRGCEAAHLIGRDLALWVGGLRKVFDENIHAPPSFPELFSIASEPVFHNDSSPPALQLTLSLAQKAAYLTPTLGHVAKNIQDAIRRRMFPELSAEEWSGVVLAATVRAYVLLIDSHGAWAPFDEETSLYEVELEATGRQHLWGQMTRTIAGVRIDSQPVSPLTEGDVVMAIDGIPTAGLSVEQVEQLGILDPNDRRPSRDVLLLRRGWTAPQHVTVAPVSGSMLLEEGTVSVELERVAYRGGYLAVLRMLDVPDDLGVELVGVLAEARLEGEPEGVVLDLRGNGGGSIEGAKEALGPFLPGAPLFPMRRRSGKLEYDRAPSPAMTDRWMGPVAVLVDSETASAAEMIAGALAAYERGIVVGGRTYGKGCAQEYLNDEAGVGVLRLSTLLYALPNGEPVQKVGIQPCVPFDFGTKENREDVLVRAMSPWRGPDIREARMIRPIAWPLHGGLVGPCRDENVCRALRTIGLPGKSARSKQISTPNRP